MQTKEYTDTHRLLLQSQLVERWKHPVTDPRGLRWTDAHAGKDLKLSDGCKAEFLKLPLSREVEYGAADGYAYPRCEG